MFHEDSTRRIAMSEKPETTKKEPRIRKADELAKGYDAELNEEELERVSGGTGNIMKSISDTTATIVQNIK
jgi:hypothetical protein